VTSVANVLFILILVCASVVRVHYDTVVFARLADTMECILGTRCIDFNLYRYVIR
jgi:hypothetical protein